MDPTALIQAFLTLFVVIDPIAVAPLFMALTTGMDPARRQRAAIRAILVATAVLTVFGLFGEALLRYAGISLDAFRISGGMLLFLIAVEMLFEKRTPRRRNQVQAAQEDHPPEHPEDDPAVFPIAVPLVAGPGAMATMVLLASQQGGWGWLLEIHLVLLAVLAITLVLTRLFGILLAALAVQIVLDGLGGFGLSPTGPGAGAALHDGAPAPMFAA